jgi:hypothetical protein
VDGVRRLIGLWRAVDEGDGFDGPDYERGRFETLLNCADELEAALTSGPSGVDGETEEDEADEIQRRRLAAKNAAAPTPQGQGEGK